ncbi:glycoside hydrolase family 16 protein [Fomitiporia mediterranea MF3/22]|uniref:glycoside hydrolase family 16 protein n=1 Tax=Fomitiporia mediterranea (strain MF3/22) TaxID=694068 RepID=UPI0004409ACE|nr:glycoside hydrolase family 16 protein [Fomitiporia mediterranea MF3/22]EJC97937.1 glycoside hydrolase family 16 protein [Fomitiporia mediterranea MF3/22]
MWDAKDPDLDDPLHNPDPIRDAALDRSFTFFSWRGWANASVLTLIVVGIITLFVGYPIIADTTKKSINVAGFNLGGINASGQVPDLPNFPTLIDKDTPSDLYTKKGSDGNTYNLVFSDEFNVDGRSFYPGDDPYWEAVDLHYWPTGDLEWYDPSAVTTANGKLVFTMAETPNHDLSFMSGMLQSWNKFCFTTGIIEVSVSLPGDAETPGLWPAIWTMGNLGRAGYGATTEGMWPYTYAACDLGTFPNQTDANGNPTAVDGLSFLPGQRASACTCDGSDHPGPDVGTGRGVPEIDIFEAQIDTSLRKGQVSQSSQVAPYNADYHFDRDPSVTTIYDSSQTMFNTYNGSVFQQATSALTYTDSANYGGNGFATYGFEWWSNEDNRNEGYVQWESTGTPAWKMTAASVGPDSVSQVSQRLISEEPHYIIMNLGMSPSFQAQDFKNLKFPVSMYVDWIRVYQRQGVQNTGCDPKRRPTADYINNHINAYSNPNLTTWAQAGYTFPRNSLFDGC